MGVISSHATESRYSLEPKEVSCCGSVLLMLGRALVSVCASIASYSGADATSVSRVEPAGPLRRIAFSKSSRSESCLVSEAIGASLAFGILAF